MQWGFPGGCLVKNPPANAGDEGSIPRSGRCPKRGNSNVFQYSCLENSMDRQAWRATVHGVTNSQDIPSHYCMAKRRGKGGSSDRFPLLGLQNHYGQWLQPWNQKTISSWQESDDKHRQCIESRDITLPTKVHMVKAMVFPVVMCSCETQTIKKAECQKIVAFKLWCWRRLLKVPWTARRSNQSILREINPE